MKKSVILIVICLFSVSAFAQSKKAYDAGEWFKFRIHYGWFNASFATLEVKDEILNNKEVDHVLGRGKSTGLLHLFFEVDDDYQTYINKKTGQPLKFVRKINEGGHTKDKEILFDQENNTAKVTDNKHQTVKDFTTKNNVHDMLSVFYYLRNKIDRKNIKEGDEIVLDLFFDDENYRFKTVFLKREVLKTKFGKVRCLKFRPYVQADRVFKKEESLTLWVSDDDNKIPVKIKAELAIGALEADLDAYKGLKNPFQIIMQ
ncbi:DUF3108 domain-containing protein [Mesonia sp. MT50]|uniref:DUF3108 domain-containing protein n=1 Tax=Mesonia profundi TaxID=3070998 RepID=A0ABU1A2Z4_9FLAO|nr:DUF3108 domain-containing protein [Mesonia profundi]MDQ7918083.1 DUF3108 domain-containing protein [Mesonia profundi]